MKTVQFDFSNIGGLLSLYAFPLSSVLSLKREYPLYSYTLLLQNETEVIALPVFANDTYSFTEEQVDSEAGDGWSISIEGVIPKRALKNEEMIHVLERGEWYVVAVDQNGTAHLCGDEETLLRFRTNKTTGASAADRNQIAFTFTCLQANPTLLLSL